MLTALDPNLVPVLRDDIIQRDEGDGELLLYNPDTDQLHRVRGVGRLLLERCTGATPLGAIIDELAREPAYAVLASPYGRSCLARFIQELAERGLVTLQGA